MNSYFINCNSILFKRTSNERRNTGYLVATLLADRLDRSLYSLHRDRFSGIPDRRTPYPVSGKRGEAGWRAKRRREKNENVIQSGERAIRGYIPWRARNFKRDLPIRRFSSPPSSRKPRPSRLRKNERINNGRRATESSKLHAWYTRAIRANPPTTDSALISFGVRDSWRMINHAEDLFPSCFVPSPALGSSCYIPSRCIHNCGMIVGSRRDCRWRYCRRYLGKWVLNRNIRSWDKSEGKGEGGEKSLENLAKYFNYNYILYKYILIIIIWKLTRATCNW